jgi:RimJ/RimL family protein N-acetyltransferase
MFALRKAEYAAAYGAYKRQAAFFPLIAATLAGEQAGIVYSDESKSPQCFYVEHAFGFAQVFGNISMNFEERLKNYLVVERSFAATKVRFYGECLPAFLKSSLYTSMRSERQRFILANRQVTDAEYCQDNAELTVRIEPLRTKELAAVESSFGVVNRFWRDGDDFLNKAHAIVAWHEGEPVAICYAAAVAEGQAEIDVLTLPAFRRTGIGKRVVCVFIRHCLSLGLQPVWDCFTNNVGSMALCKATGFIPARPAYPFFTFER